MHFHLGRRTFLRGAGGAALALPALEIMGEGGARGATSISKRFVIAYCGCTQASMNQVVPAARGADYEPTPGLQPIFDTSYGFNGLRNDMGIVSGLMIPWATNPGDVDRNVSGSVPPAGRVIGFHGSTNMPQLTGVRCERTDAPPPGVPTADQIVAQAVRGNATFASLQFAVQPSNYIPARYSPAAPLSHNRDGGLTATSSLRAIYQKLFGTTTTLDSANRTASVSSTFDRHKTILDLVNGSAKRLLPRLGGEDRLRMEKHFQYITELEKSIDDLRMKIATTGVCKRPDVPADPPIGDITYDPDIPGDNFATDDNAGWSNEELRAQIQADFLHLALTCDLSRVATWLISERQGELSCYHINGNRISSHSASHGAGDSAPLSRRRDLALFIGWHVKHLGRLVGKLRDTNEVDGSSLLDHSALCMLFEGGIGRDPEGGGDDKSHSTENMVAIVAGRAGGLKAGQHVAFRNDRNPAQVVLSLMKAVGVNGPLGDLGDDQVLPELFG